DVDVVGVGALPSFHPLELGSGSLGGGSLSGGSLREGRRREGEGGNPGREGERTLRLEAMHARRHSAWRDSDPALLVNLCSVQYPARFRVGQAEGVLARLEAISDKQRSPVS